MEFLDGTVMATAIPRMALCFGVRPVDLGIGMSAYLVTLAVLLPVSDWVAGRLGPRLVFTAALAGFTAASALCAASTGLAVFVAARVLQGASGAIMVPVGRLAVLRTTPKRDLMGAMATLTWPALLALQAAAVLAPGTAAAAPTPQQFHIAFLTIGVLGLAAVGDALGLATDAGVQVTRA